MNEKINSGDIVLNQLELTLLNTGLSFSNEKVFSKRSVSDLVEGYTDFVVDLIVMRRPNIFRNGKFNLLNGVIAN